MMSLDQRQQFAGHAGLRDTSTEEQKQARFERFIRHLNRHGYNFVKINEIAAMKDGSKYVSTKTGALVHVVDNLEPTKNYGN